MHCQDVRPVLDSTLKFGATITLHWLDERPFAASEAYRLSPRPHQPLMAWGGGGTLHRHEYHEIVLLVSGRIRHVCNGETGELAAGDVLFLRADDEHRLERIGLEPCEWINVAYAPQVIADADHFLGAGELAKRFMGPPRPPCHRPPPQLFAELLREAMELYWSTERKEPQARLTVRAWLFRVLTSQLLVAPVKSALTLPRWLEQLCAGLNDAAALRDGVHWLARHAACSQAHLCREFRRHLQQTPTDHVNRRRCVAAAQRLTQTRDTLFAIARDLGFTSLSHFHRLFRAQYGRTPAEYRNRKR
ncbi:MAG: AraC family transcriptional regulator [Lentisphaeria bacterium]